MKKIVVEKLSTDFRNATRIVKQDIPTKLNPFEVLVKNKFLGINASDINFSAGIYRPDVQVPFDCGFEAVGEVATVGESVKNLTPGDFVVTQAYGSFAEYQVVSSRYAKKVPSLRKEWLPLDLSGTTASIALAEVLKPLKGETAIVTAAAGGTGHIAVQLFKHVYECNVIGTCSSSEKKELLHTLGCDTVVVGAEKNTDLLKNASPRGINVAYESVGGSLFDAVLENLALKGRILSIGSITNYQEGSLSKDHGQKPLQLRLLSKSATLHAFFLPHYVKYSGLHFKKLCDLLEKGTIKVLVDSTEFKGLKAVPDAIDHMYERKNVGKVIVELP